MIKAGTLILILSIYNNNSKGKKFLCNFSIEDQPSLFSEAVYDGIVLRTGT